MFRASPRVAAASAIGFDAVVKAISSGRVSLSVPDLYRICALTKEAHDPLDLKSNSELMTGLATQYRVHKENADAAPINPFQGALLEETLSHFAQDIAPPATSGDSTHLSSNGKDGEGLLSEVATGKSASSVAQGEPTGQQRVQAIWEILNDAKRASTAVEESDENGDGSYEVTGDTIHQIQKHVEALERQLRDLNPRDVSRLVTALAVVNYTNYQHTSLLARRGCEVGASLSNRQVCKLYFNLHKLGTHDSLQALVNHLQSKVGDLSAEDVFLVAQALERQPNTSAATARLAPSLVRQGAQKLADAPSASYHRALLAVLARYNLANHPALMLLLKDLVPRAKTMGDRDLLSILHILGELSHDRARSRELYEALMGRAVSMVPTMDIRNVDALMDILSFLPADSTAVMQAIMLRLETDAGKLTIPQVDQLLKLLSSYPPAKGQVCIVSLAFAAALRAESIDGVTLESMLVSLAVLQHFTDDFCAIAEVLQRQKGGIRRLDSVLAILEHFPPSRPQVAAHRGQQQQPTAQSIAAVDPKVAHVVQQAILTLAPSLNDEELAHCRRLLQSANLLSAEVQQRLIARARQLQRGGNAGSGRGGGWGRQGQRGRGRQRRPHYDPMGELLD